MDVVPVQAEGFAFADAGADEDLDEVGEGAVCGVAAVEEADRIRRGPDVALPAAGLRMTVGRAGL
ncbi:hypothetical protein ACIQOV_31780 [Kitasatospora sp. NPDC091257]|uniref:hypothetical protein n=1 Tax=Kitasatospora sp. NPDC091257 TaxID=3364084 RepID=UPI0038303894